MPVARVAEEDCLYATIGEPMLLRWLLLHLPQRTLDNLADWQVVADAHQLHCVLRLTTKDKRVVNVPIRDTTTELDEDTMLKVIMLV